MLKVRSIAPALFVALVVAAAVDGVAVALEPVYDVVDHPLPGSAQHLSMDAIRGAIMAACKQRQWLFRASGPGELLATQEAHGYRAKVKVTYSQKAYSISLVATNMERSGNEIYGKYNRWIRNLEKDIDVQLAVEAVQSQ